MGEQQRNASYGVVATARLAKSDGTVVALADVIDDIRSNLADGIGIDASQVNIGSVEVKDGVADIYLTVAADGAQFAAYVQSNSLAQQATLVLNLAQVTGCAVSLALIDNVIATSGAAHPGVMAATGARAETAIPAAVDDGDIVAPASNEYGRKKSAAYDDAQAAESVSDVAPAQMQVQLTTDFAALDTPGQLTPAVNVQDFENHTVVYIIANIDTSVDLIIWGSLDGTNWFPMDEWTVLAADAQIDAREISGFKTRFIRCEFDAEAGGAAATVTFQIMNGN